MKKLLRISAWTLSILITCIVLYINIALHCGPDLSDGNETKADVLKQLAFLEGELKNNQAGQKMQQLYPEGFVFIHALYGLTWMEIAATETKNSILHKKSLEEARYAYREIDAAYSRNVFDSTLLPAYGIYYRGWSNLLLGKIVSLDGDSLERLTYVCNCKEIADAFYNSESPYPESYPNMSWPADACVAMASLAEAKRSGDTAYNKAIITWVNKVRKKQDPKTELIANCTDAKTGATLEGARGSSSSLILILLADIDPLLAQEQFKKYRNHFSITRFGLPAILEYPGGTAGEGSIDSGPVILDVGFAGTIVSIGTFRKFNETDQANMLSACIDGFGFPVTTGGKKRYLAGQLPMCDAFIAWARMQEPVWYISPGTGETFGSAMLFHLYSFCIVLVLACMLYWKRILIKIKGQHEKQ